MDAASSGIEGTDREIVVAVRNGTLDAFAALTERYHPRLLRYLVRRTGNPELAADLAQEAFLDAYRHLDRLGDEGSFGAWLFGIAQNRLRMEWRRQRLRRVVSLAWLPEQVTAAIPALRHAGGEEASHERDLIDRVLAELSPPLRDALLLHGLAGLTAPEVARALGISLEAAERRISRAKERFRARYREMNR